MPSPSLPNFLAAVVDNDIITGPRQVFDKIGSDYLFRSRRVDDHKPRSKAVCPEQLVELPELIADVPDRPSIDDGGLSEHLRPGLPTLADHRLLGEPR